MSRKTILSRSILAACSCACLGVVAVAQTAVKPTQVSPTQAQPLDASAKTLPVLPPTLTLQPVGRSVRAMVITPDGKHAITGDLDGTVRMVEIASNKVVRSFTGHAGEVTTLSVTPDGRFIATGGIDKTARVFDTQTAAQISAHTHTQPVRGVALVSGGKGLEVYSASGKEITHWIPEPQTPSVRRTINAHQGTITAIAVDPMGKVGISGSEDGYVFSWEPATGKVSGSMNLSPQKVSITSVNVEPTTMRALAADASGNVVYFDPMGLKEMSRFKGLMGQPVKAVAFSKDGKRAIAAGANKAFTFEPMTGMASAEFTPNKVTQYCGTVDPVMPNRVLIGGDMDNTDPAHAGSVRMFDTTPR